ncbi:mandelate racemase/muconate lactonizing enzyme family protein [Halorussus halophilus]|uniref:mandelate racemase/muconate lactonizing enzyme family protein n=1 Tax=Halorussus halophilus TaxID=2650975 RepID=UPI0013017FDC|nr:mandelate racemase/muconate lactonizing enzyme family protein [Halorussus halophilus]
MAIAEVDTYVVGTPPPHKGGQNWVFVKLTADDGTVGFGECNWTEYRAHTLVQLIEDLEEEFIIGTDPFEIEDLRARLYRGSHFLHVPGPLHAQVVGAIEMACWDIAGKQVGKPVYKLLGGKLNDELRSYTYLHWGWNPPESPEKAAEVAAEYVEKGFTALKFEPLYPQDGPRDYSLEDLEYAASVVGAVREAVGDRCDILVGTHGQMYTQTAIRFAERIEKYDPLWFEEPVPPENVNEMAKVADATNIPIATGERLLTKHQVENVLQADAAQIIQPNVGMNGILESKKIAGMCESQYAQIAPWMYCGPVAGAANLQLGACSPNFLLQEGIEQWGGFQAEILEEPIEWKDGYVRPPTGPGLGIEVDESVLKEHAHNQLPAPGDRHHYQHHEKP